MASHEVSDVDQSLNCIGYVRLVRTLRNADFISKIRNHWKGLCSRTF